MADIKVNQVAKEYGCESSEIIKAISELGEYVASAKSSIAPPVYKRLKEVLGEPKPKPVTDKTDAVNKTKKSDNTSKDVATDAKSGDKSQNVDIKQPPVDANISFIPKPGAGKVIKPVADDDSKNIIPTPKKDDTDIRTSGISNPFGIKSSDIPKPSMIRRPTVVNTRNGSRYGRNNGLIKAGEVPKPRSRPDGDKKLNRPKDGVKYTAGSKTPSNQPSRPGPFQGGFVKTGGKTRKGVVGGAHGKGPQQKTKSHYDKKKRLQQELEELEHRTAAGVVVPHGDGSTVVRLHLGATLGDFAEKINANPGNVVMTLVKLGVTATQNQSLDQDTFEILGSELGYRIEMVSEEEVDLEILESFDIDLNEDIEDDLLEERPPVVTVMGHVDHGKTKLLDAIRNSDVIGSEAGGITQRIGAYQVHLTHDDVDRKITFIDTPGHEAFTAMRARGAEITDLAILVVAADDGVMPQTVEAINHAQSANVPIVVAVNKVDKEGADPDKVRGQLTEFNLIAEEYGGDTMFVDISAKQNKGITELLDAVLLTVDAAMELKSNPNTFARGSVIESRLDKGRGAVASVLVQNGTLKVGDPIVAGRSYGKVRAMTDANGKKVKSALPSQAVRILGMQTVPTAGDLFLVAQDERQARQIAEKREAVHRAAMLSKRKKRITLEDFTKAVEDGRVDMLNLIIKGDTSGKVEALESELAKLEQNAELNGEVGLNVIHRGVGSITQNDVNLATVDNAIIIGFDVKAEPMVSDLADSEGVDIRYYDVIYKASEDIENSLHGLLKPETEEDITGYAEVREIFKSSKFGSIAGSIVRGGEIKRNAKARVLRDGDIIAQDLKIESLKRFKDDATSVKEGFECGIGLGSSYSDLEAGDIIETFDIVEKQREVKKISSRS